MSARRAVWAAAGMGLALGAITVLAGVTGTKHDFSRADWNRVDGTRRYELCLPCHTPHNATGEALWNRPNPADSAFTKWEDAELGFESLSCLSCHDGATALDSFSGQIGTEVMQDPDTIIGTDLRDDHPVGVDYPGTTAGGTNWGPVGTIRGTQPAVVTAVGSTTGIPIYGDAAPYKIECSTCHTPHSNTLGYFLRFRNNDAANPSGLCVLCHLRQK